MEERNMNFKIVHTAESHGNYLHIPWDSWFRRSWDFFAFLLVLFSTFQVPFSLAFPNYEISSGWIQFVEIFFLVDIALNFFTSYVYKGQQIITTKAIALKYLKTWFLYDIMASFPWEKALTFLAKEQRNSLTLLRWTKLAKLLRIFKVCGFLKQYLRYYHLSVLLFILLVILHLASCVWLIAGNICDIGMESVCCNKVEVSSLYLVALMNGIEIILFHQEMSMVDILYLFNFSLHTYCDNEEYVERSIVQSHLPKFSLYKYNQNLLLVKLFFGILGTATLFAILSQMFIIAHMKASVRFAFINKIDSIKGELSHGHKISYNLKYKIKKYYDYLKLNNKTEQSSLLTDENLSVPLRKELAEELFQETLRKVHIFKNCKKNQIYEIASRLKNRIFLPGDVIFKEGDIAYSMFFIDRGMVVVNLSVEKSIIEVPLKHKNYKASNSNVVKTQLSCGLLFEEETLFDYRSFAPTSKSETYSNAAQVLMKERDFESSQARSAKVAPLSNVCEIQSSDDSEGSSRDEFKNSNLMLRSGSYFGELSLLTSNPRAKTVTSKTMSDLKELHKSDFQTVMSFFPELYNTMIVNALAHYPFLTREMVSPLPLESVQHLRILEENQKNILKFLKFDVTQKEQ